VVHLLMRRQGIPYLRGEKGRKKRTFLIKRKKKKRVDSYPLKRGKKKLNRERMEKERACLNNFRERGEGTRGDPPPKKRLRRLSRKKKKKKGDVISSDRGRRCFQI